MDDDATPPAGDLPRAALIVVAVVALLAIGLIAWRVHRNAEAGLAGRPAPMAATSAAPEPVLPHDATHTEPRGATDKPDPAEVLRRLGPDVPGDEVAMWADPSRPLLLFVAVRPEAPIGDGQVVGRVGGELQVFEPVHEPLVESSRDGASPSTTRAYGDARVFATAIAQPALSRAIVSATPSIRGRDDSFAPVGPRDAEGRVIGITWRGPEAPPAPASAQPLAGTVRTEQVFSEAMGEYRAVTFYLPPGYDPAAAQTPGSMAPAVVYMGDGQFVARLARVVEPLIVAGTVRPVAIVGAHSGTRIVRPPSRDGTRPRGGLAVLHPFAGDPRAAEYVEPQPGLAAEVPFGQAIHEHMFDRHYRFFADELPRWTQATLGVSGDRADRVVIGFSNAAALAIVMAQRRPDVVGGAIAANPVGARPPGASANPRGLRPRVYLTCGSWDKLSRPTTYAWARHLESARFEVRQTEVVGGHDRAVWEMAVVDALPWLLPPRDAAEGARGGVDH